MQYLKKKKPIELYFLILEARTLRSRCLEVWCLLLALYKAVLSPCALRLSLCISVLGVPLYGQISSAYKDTSQTGLGPMKCPYFKQLSVKISCIKIQSHSEVLGGGVRTGVFGLRGAQAQKWPSHLCWDWGHHTGSFDFAYTSALSCWFNFCFSFSYSSYPDWSAFLCNSTLFSPLKIPPINYWGSSSHFALLTSSGLHHQ